MHNHRWKFCAIGLLTLTCLAGTARAEPQDYPDRWGYFGRLGTMVDASVTLSAGGSLRDYRTSDDSRLESNIPRAAFTNTSAYADPITQAVGGWAVADDSWYGEGGTAIPGQVEWDQGRPWAGSEAYVRNRLDIGAGSSGLAPGDAVRLRATLRIDGALQAGAGFSWYNTMIMADAAFAIVDPTVGEWRADGPESTWFQPMPLVDLWMSSGLDRSLSTYSSWWENEFAMDWELSTFADGLIASDSAYEYNFDSLPSVILPDAPLASALQKAIDTGELVVEFDSYIGAALYTQSEIGLWVANDGDSYGLADFLSTVAVSFEPVDQPGLDLSWTVPEPATLSLLTMGAAALLRRRR